MSSWRGITLLAAVALEFAPIEPTDTTGVRGATLPKCVAARFAQIFLITPLLQAHAPFGRGLEFRGRLAYGQLTFAFVAATRQKHAGPALPIGTG
jgi:hypothetical protein